MRASLLSLVTRHLACGNQQVTMAFVHVSAVVALRSSQFTNPRTHVFRTGAPQLLSVSNRRRATHTRGCSGPTAAAAAATSGHPEALQQTWPAFATKMRETDSIPPQAEWHALLDGCIRANDSPATVVWLMNLMIETDVPRSAVTYEKLLEVCVSHKDRVAAFHIIEQMLRDKVKLDDVELPFDLEDTLRTLLPPDAFE